MRKPIYLIIDGLPPSVNRHYSVLRQGRAVVSREWRSYKNLVWAAWLRSYKTHERKGFEKGVRLSVTIYLYLKYPLKSDCDNRQKVLLDALQKNGIIAGDNYIFNLRTVKRSAKQFEHTEIVIEELEYEP